MIDQNFLFFLQQNKCCPSRKRNIVKGFNYGLSEELFYELLQIMHLGAIKRTSVNLASKLKSILLEAEGFLD